MQGPAGPTISPPDYTGGSLLNLVAELERRLTGSALHPGLHGGLADLVPEAETYVLVLFDGLGDHQLDHPTAAPLRASRVAALDAPFPTTTTVSMSTIATGMSPAEHGLLGYELWLPEVDEVVRTIKWMTLWGEPIDHDYPGFLPAPNLWERVTAAGAEPITVQPWNFGGSPMSQMLYRGCRFEPWWSEDDAPRATASLAGEPGRLVFLYVPHVDFAAHVAGQGDPAYSEALGIAATVWSSLAAALPDGAVAIGTADHGHVDVPPGRHHEISKGEQGDRILYGDSRAMFVRGAPLDPPSGGAWVPRSDMEEWWGPGNRHPRFGERAPDGVLVAPDGGALLHRHSDDRLIGQHGALTPEEMRIPLLVAESV
jgi:hypothetical protein